MVNIMNKAFAIIKPLALAILFIGFTGGAAMALDDAVTHQTLGMAAWVMSFVLIGAWVVEGIVQSYSQKFKFWKESDNGHAIFATIVLVLAIIMIITIAVSLGLH